MQKGFKEHIQKQLKEGKTGEQLTMGNFEKTRLRVASNKPFAAARAYQRGVTRAASNIRFRPHIKYPRPFAGGYLFVGFCLKYRLSRKNHYKRFSKNIRCRSIFWNIHE